MLDNTGVFFAFVLPVLIFVGCPFFFIPLFFLKKKQKIFNVLYWIFLTPWLLLLGMIGLVRLSGIFTL